MASVLCSCLLHRLVCHLISRSTLLLSRVSNSISSYVSVRRQRLWPALVETCEPAYSKCLSYNFVWCVDMRVTCTTARVSASFLTGTSICNQTCVSENALATTFNSVAAFMSSSGWACKSCSVLATVFILAFGSVAASVQTSDGSVTLFMSSQLSWPPTLLGIQSACPKMPHHWHRPECRWVFWPSPLLGFGASC